MHLLQRKGSRRRRLDIERIVKGEPRSNQQKNRDLNCRFPQNGKAFRKKGRDRFKTGHKRQKPGKSSR